MTTTATLADAVEALETLYPRRYADSWDSGIGLTVGDPAAGVRRVLFAVDPVQEVVDEAVAGDVDLLVVHHPLLFRPVQTIAGGTPKGKVIHDLVSHGVGLYVAHTNADSPPLGVSESMAHALRLREIRPLSPDPADPTVKLVTFVPEEDTQRVVDALSAAGAGQVGDYDRCAFMSEGRGTFRPGAGAHPTIGAVGAVEVVKETRVETVVPRHCRDAVVAALWQAHPYEEPAYDLVPVESAAADRGTGRVGVLAEPMSLGDFVGSVVQALPPTAVGARVAGDLERPVERVALVGGAGDFMLDAARAEGADVYVTSDLRHHPASEFREHPDAPALVDVSHWAAEWTWLPVAQRALADELDRRALTIDTKVSQTCTDPWNYCATVHHTA
ncbi:MAG: Nif3-like dinuclear metal center hexameric protein [Nocardioidaceae bacterium]